MSINSPDIRDNGFCDFRESIKSTQKCVESPWDRVKIIHKDTKNLYSLAVPEAHI
jgi:hypothetical protein